MIDRKFKKVRVRDDDVLISSRGRAGNEFGRFVGFHKMVCLDERHFIHVPAILVTDIQKFPECIAYIKEETAAGRMLPEIHGLHHKDYANLTSAQIVEELIEAKAWIRNAFDYEATVWYSPHGAGADKRGAHLREAALSIGLTLVTCEGMIIPSRLVYDVRSVAGRDRETGQKQVDPTMTKEQLLAKWEGKEILRHWWESVGALTESITWFRDNV